jgi:hypothetical protein
MVIPAGDGVPLLANRFYPADIDQAPLVLLRSPYGRGAALDRMPQLFAERGYQVLYVSLRGPMAPVGSSTDSRITPQTRTARCRGCPCSRGSAECWPPGVPATSVSSSGSSPPATSRNGRSRSSKTHRRVRRSVHVSRRRISRWQRARLGADRRSHVSCRRWNGLSAPRCVDRPQVDAPRGGDTACRRGGVALTGPVARRDRGHQARQLQLTQH